MQNGKKAKRQGEALSTTIDAVIYCRVSSQKQVTEGNGLDSQEFRCMKYANQNDYNVHQVFVEKGKSGGFEIEDRPALAELIGFIEARRMPFTIIVDDLSRMSRDVRLYLEIKDLTKKYGCKLVSVGQRFSDDEFGEFFEVLTVGFSELERRNNKARVRNRMEARLRQGHYAWSRPPLGYKRVSGSKDLVRDEPGAAIMAEVFTGYARGRFGTQQHIVDWLKTNPEYAKARKAPPTLTWVKKVLQNPLYAGYLKYDKWSVELTRGVHEPIIGMDVFAVVQAKLNGRVKHKVYETKRLDFPLRGHILCDECGQAITGSWSKGRTERYPYYYCKNTRCSVKPRGQRTHLVHQSFSTLLGEITPRPQVLQLMRVLLRDAYLSKAKGAKATEAEKAVELKKLNDQVNAALDALLDGSNAGIKDELRRRVENLQIKRDALEQELKAEPWVPDLDAITTKAIAFISNPKAVWHSGNLEQKEMVLNLAFSDRLRFKPGVGFKTADISMPFSVLGGGVSSVLEDGGA